MRIVVQRVAKARVFAEGRLTGEISKGLLSLVGYARGDSEEKNLKALQKIHQLRVFPDANDRMNLSLIDIQGGHLLVSRFTLLGDLQKGLRPGFDRAEAPERARELFFQLQQQAQHLAAQQHISIGFGEFQAAMQVELINDGPATFILEI